MLPESRKVASLLLQGLPAGAWQKAIEVENVLQKTSPAGAKRIASLIRARLETMTDDLWLLARDGDRDIAMQAIFAASIKHSALLGDFIDIVVRERFRGFHNDLPKTSWAEYLDICRSRDPEMPVWKDSTAKKLGEHVYRILSEVHVLADRKSYRLRKMTVRREVKDNLQGHGERYVLRCLEALE
ncbi:MAG: hypothetical protein JWO19_6028 [Bryobacterales bacterium]|nr:hypothetical protein [Bryobacterales bacterium]